MEEMFTILSSHILICQQILIREHFCQREVCWMFAEKSQTFSDEIFFCLIVVNKSIWYIVVVLLSQKNCVVVSVNSAQIWYLQH